MLEGNDLRQDRSQMNEIDDIGPNRTRLDHDRMITTAERPGAGAPGAAETIAEGALQPMHAGDQIAPRRFERQMILIRLQRKGMQLPLHPLAGLEQAIDKDLGFVGADE